MASDARKLDTGLSHRCETLNEAVQKVNDIVFGHEKWVIILLPDESPGREETIASGMGPLRE